MDTQKNTANTTEDQDQQDSIEEAFQQMEVLYKSRCIDAPVGTHVTIREVKSNE